jgi:hypothetical protein
MIMGIGIPTSQSKIPRMKGSLIGTMRGIKHSLRNKVPPFFWYFFPPLEHNNGRRLSFEIRLRTARAKELISIQINPLQSGTILKHLNYMSSNPIFFEFLPISS